MVEFFNFGTSVDTIRAARITAENGAEAVVLSYGATLQSLRIPSGGGLRNVVLGFDSMEKYRADKGYHGATVGRVANRIHGPFAIDGRTYIPSANEGPNTLHGGIRGFDKKIWSMELGGPSSVVFRVKSPDGEEGFPGNLRASVTYTLTEDGALRLDYKAETDKATPVSLTNHSYFNPDGGDSVLEDSLQISADFYTETDSALIPTGRVLPVEKSPLDFRTAHAIGDAIRDPALISPGTYDHNFCLRGEGLRHAAALSGRLLTIDVETTSPGLQFYCAPVQRPFSFSDGRVLSGNVFVCLETQQWPDAVHHENFPSCILYPYQTYRETTIYRFSPSETV